MLAAMLWTLILFLYSADQSGPKLIAATTVASYPSENECDAMAKDLIEYHPLPKRQH